MTADDWLILMVGMVIGFGATLGGIILSDWRNRARRRRD